MKRENLEKLDKSALIDIILVRQEQIIALVAKVAELEARLNQNSQNSSKPPSSDVFVKPKSLRKPSGKKPGGQEGHDGNSLKINREPDRIVTHDPTKCANCPKRETCSAVGETIETRYELDIEIRPSLTAHRTNRKICSMTGEILTGEFPEGINSTMQYGVNIESLAVSLNTIGTVSINRTHEILRDVFDIPISTGTISSMVKDCAEDVAEPVTEIGQEILEQPVVHFDETGTRVAGELQWTHVASTPELTYLSVHKKRGKDAMNEIGILPNYRGKGIHDCLSSYFTYLLMLHQLCCAHLLRELTGIIENFGQAWAQRMADLLVEMKNLKEKLIDQHHTEASLELREKYSRMYDEIMAEALEENPVPPEEPNKRGRPKRGKAGALVDRLILRKENYMLFFNDFEVPFDNNQAERDFRMFKVKQKVSGCFRTKEGAEDYAAIMSYVGTARKMGFSAFQAIKAALLKKPFSLKKAGATL